MDSEHEAVVLTREPGGWVVTKLKVSGETMKLGSRSNPDTLAMVLDRLEDWALRQGLF